MAPSKRGMYAKLWRDWVTSGCDLCMVKSPRAFQWTGLACIHSVELLPGDEKWMLHKSSYERAIYWEVFSFVAA